MTTFVSHKNLDTCSITPAACLNGFSLSSLEVGTPRHPQKSVRTAVGFLGKLYPSDDRATQETSLFPNALHIGGPKPYPGLVTSAEYGNRCDDRSVQSVTIGQSFPMYAEGFEVDCDEGMIDSIEGDTSESKAIALNNLVRRIPIHTSPRRPSTARGRYWREAQGLSCKRRGIQMPSHQTRTTDASSSCGIRCANEWNVRTNRS